MKKLCGIYGVIVLAVVIGSLIMGCSDMDKPPNQGTLQEDIRMEEKEIAVQRSLGISQGIDNTTNLISFWRIDIMESVKEHSVIVTETKVIKPQEPDTIDCTDTGEDPNKNNISDRDLSEAISMTDQDVKEAVIVEPTIKDHSVNAAGAKIYHPYTALFSDTIALIKAGDTTFETAHLQSLAEIDHIFFGSAGIFQPVSETLGGPITGVMLKAEHEDVIRTAITKYEEAEARYQNYIQDALYGMDLKATDESLVDEMNAYIVNNFSYAVTNEPFMSGFVDQKTGQCCHYAHLFRDMCCAVGISCSYIEGSAQGESHAFNCVTIDGIRYYFDVSWNDVCGDKTKYSWLSESDLRKTHSW